MEGLIVAGNKPNMGLLSALFSEARAGVGNRNAEDIRFCRWPNQHPDGRKHDAGDRPEDAAKPWDGASDCRPMLVDAIIEERVAVKTVAFWRSMLRPGMATGKEGEYAVRLAEHLLWKQLYGDLVREVELSAQYEETYGWCALALKWRRDLGLRRVTMTLDRVSILAGVPKDAILDPTNEEEMLAVLRRVWMAYVELNLPRDVRDRVEPPGEKQFAKWLKELREKEQTDVVIPYVAYDGPDVLALKPNEEVFIPPSLAGNPEVVFQVQLLTEAEVRGRVLVDGWDETWVDRFLERGAKHGGAWVSADPWRQLGTLMPRLYEVAYAVYVAPDEDGIPAVWMTVFDPLCEGGRDGEEAAYAKHELLEGIGGRIPYVIGVREWVSRSPVGARGVPELAGSHQWLLKGILDGMIDRQSLTLVPPVNVYENPVTAHYRFGPAQQNYVRQGREPKFMDLPSSAGVVDAVKAYEMLRAAVDNYFGLQTERVPQPRTQAAQEMMVQRFLLTWTKAIQMMLCLCQRYMSDDEFSKITGAPLGWLEERRFWPDILSCELHFDARELDPELAMQQIEAVNKTVLPTDVLGVIDRAKWAEAQLRMINPALAKELVTDQAAASQRIYERAKLELLNMFVGTPPTYVDKDDPTAAALLRATQQVLQSNPNFMRALTDEALAVVVGDPGAAQAVAAQLGPRSPNPAFSELLVKWIENLRFVGVTQQQNRLIGRIGVNPGEGV